MQSNTLLGFHMDMSTSRKILASMAALMLLAIFVSVIQNIWMKSQFEKNTNYYLNQGAVEALALEIDKELLYFVEKRELAKVERLLKARIKSNTEVIKERLNNSRHNDKTKSLLKKALKYEAGDSDVNKT